MPDLIYQGILPQTILKGSGPRVIPNDVGDRIEGLRPAVGMVRFGIDNRIIALVILRLTGPPQ